jgi:hypothetical protein
MPETPDFDQIARQAINGSEFHIKRVAEQLRLVWNARGAADVTKVEAMLAYDGTSRIGLDAMLDQAIRTLDVRPVRHCDCIASGNTEKPKQDGADPHAKNCAIYRSEPA